MIARLALAADIPDDGAIVACYRFFKRAAGPKISIDTYNLSYTLSGVFDCRCLDTLPLLIMIQRGLLRHDPVDGLALVRAPCIHGFASPPCFGIPLSSAAKPWIQHGKPTVRFFFPKGRTKGCKGNRSNPFTCQHPGGVDKREGSRRGGCLQRHCSPPEIYRNLTEFDCD